MIPVEASSTISKSATSKTDVGKALLLNGRQNRMDIVFPLFDQYITNAKFPSFIFPLFKLYITIQLILSTIWPMAKSTLRCGLANDRNFSYVKVAFFFIDYAEYYKYKSSSIYLLLSLTIVVLLFLAFQLWYYTNKRGFMKWTLYLTKAILDLVIPILILFTGFSLGVSFLAVYNKSSGINWFHFIISIISYLLNNFLLYISSSFASHSVIIPSVIFPSFDAAPFINLLIANETITVFSFVLSIFPEWMEFLVPIAHIIWLGIAIISVSTFPYHDIADNMIILSLYVEAFVMDLVTIIFFFIDYKFKWTPLIIAFASFAITCVASYFIVKKTKKGIKKKLNYNEFDNDDEAQEYYSSLGLDTSGVKALRYLYAGLGQHTFGIVNMDYPKFIYKNHASNKLLISTLQAIAFFPAETRSLNALFKGIAGRRDLSYAERFVVYQIHRVKSLRASSSSNTTNDLIIELKELNGQVEANIRNFWSLTNANYTIAEELSKEISGAEIQWKEAVDAYPNNEKISSEYSRFLTECKCDFDGAIYQRQITEMIENGHNFAVDNSFISFCRTFPKYLLNDILDLHGKKIKSKKDKNGTNSNSHNNTGSTGGLSSSSFTIDAEMEEAIGKRIMRNSRMRLALHHGIDDLKSPLTKWMFISGVVMIIICFAAYIFEFLFMDSQFELRSNSVVLMNYITRARLNGYMMFDTVILNYAHLNNKLGSEKDLIGDVAELDKDFKQYWNLTEDLGAQTMHLAQKVKDALTNIFRELATLSADAVDVYGLSGSFLNEETKLAFCRNNDILRKVDGTIKNKVIFSIYQVAIATGRGDVKDIFTKNDFCETVTNFYSLPNDYGPVFKLFDKKQVDEGNNLFDMLNLIITILPVTVAVVSFVPMFIICLVFVYRLNSVIKIFENLDQSIKDEAKNPISLDAEISSQTSTIAGNTKISKLCIGMFVIFLLTAAQSVLLYFFIDSLRNKNNEIIDVGTWFTQASDRVCAIVETLCDVLMIALLGDVNISYTSREENVKWAALDMKTITNANDCLLKGCPGVKTCFGYSEDIDITHFEERCSMGSGVGKLHDIYGCASISQQISVFTDLIQEISYNPKITLNGIVEEKVMTIFHLTSSHLIDACGEVVRILRERIDNMHKVVYNQSIIYLVCGLVIAISEFIAFCFFIQMVSNTYHILLILTKHLSPTQILASKEIMDWIFNRKNSEDDKAMGTSQSIIHSTIDAIICTGLNGVVELANPAVTTLLGYTPDQILGQHIDNFLTPESQEIVNKQMSLMQNGQSAASYDDHIACVSDSAVEINFYVTIIGMKSEGSNSIASFVFILSDETELLRQQKEAEEAKARSEMLLYQILPKDIVVKLNRGEKDISFTVPSATIIFIDIVKFSEYSSTLTPQEIMGNLSIIFATFDSLVAKYPVITKIKLIGDVYMAAAGLFLPDEADPQLHAEATLKFGIDCINELEDVNMKLNASLEVRVGINTGGPLIAGVLGTDKPTFDIIGDPINISSRLQSTDIPGKIQISRATYDIVGQLGFNIEERGEVFLKGKGKQMTYIVHPHVVFMGQSGSILSAAELNSSNKLPSVLN